LCICQDGCHRHLGYVIPPVWTTHDAPIAGFCVSCQWHNDQPEFVCDIAILPFRDLGLKMPVPTNFGDFDP